MRAAELNTTERPSAASLESLPELPLARCPALERLASSNVRALTSLGALLNRALRSKEAARYLERAREISPRRQELCFELALSYLQAGRSADAAAMYRTGWMLRPESGDARLRCIGGAVATQDRALEDEVLASIRAEQFREAYRTG